MRSFGVLLTCSVLGSGCAATDGVWLIFVDPAGDLACEQVLTHNYLGAVEPTDTPVDSPWTEETTEEVSPAALFARIFDVAGEDSKVLVLGDQAYLGNKDGGVWTFTLPGQESYDDTATHEAGYTLFQHESGDLVTTLSIDLQGSAGDGTLKQTYAGLERWEETDVWDTALVGVGATQIPSGSYLVDDTGMAIWNDPHDTSCSATPCFLEISQDCEQSTTIEARRTDAGDEDFSGLEDAGRDFGIDLGNE